MTFQPRQTVWEIYGGMGLRKCEVRGWPKPMQHNPAHMMVRVLPWDHNRGEPGPRNIRIYDAWLKSAPGFPLDEDPARPIEPGAGFWIPYSHSGVRRVEIVKAQDDRGQVQVKLYDHSNNSWLKDKRWIPRRRLKASPG